MKNPYYISIIITARNDNYGGDFISRLQNCIDWNTTLLEKYKIETEFVLVNWNPVEENKPLRELIKWPLNRSYVAYRIITVPNSIHQKYNDPNIRKDVPLFEYLAKNTGIKRANGKYLLVLNPDILIHPKIIKTISKKKLVKTKYYRTNRIDYKGDLEKNFQPIKIWLKGFVYNIKSGKKLFFLKMYNFIRIKFHLHLVHFENYLYLLGWQFIKENAEFQFHCNGGDFILSAKENFFKLKGFPEDTYLSLHTDALFIIMLGVSSLKEEVFRKPIYHKEHKRRYDAKIKNDLFRKVYLSYQDEAQKMIIQRKPKIYNDKNWGLANFELPEDIF